MTTQYDPTDWGRGAEYKAIHKPACYLYHTIWDLISELHVQRVTVTFLPGIQESSTMCLVLYVTLWSLEELLSECRAEREDSRGEILLITNENGIHFKYYIL